MQRPKAKDIIETLIQLNQLDAQLKELGPRSKKRAGIEAEIEKLREPIPRQILSHHDRIIVRNRPSVAAVKDWVCQGCFIIVPSGSRVSLKQANDIHVCESCGAYIYTPEDEVEEVEAEDAKEKPKARKKKTASK